MAMSRIYALLGILLLLSGCSGWLGGDEDKRLPGKRISVMSLGSTLEPDPRLSDLAVRLPKPFVNPDWPQAGGPAKSCHASFVRQGRAKRDMDG